MGKQIVKSREAVRDTFCRHVPEDFVDYLMNLFFQANVRFSIVKSRATKLGDFRAGLQGEKHKITVNGDLNKFSFLITSLHELAHLNTFNSFGRAVMPHGEEWKTAFKKLLLPIIDSKKLPQDIENALVNSLVNMKASSCTDHQLSRVLLKYDKKPQGMAILEELPINSVFSLNGRDFVKGPLRRKRYVCQEVRSKRSYLVSSLAQVSPIEK